MGRKSVTEWARKRGLYIGNHEDRRPHGLQDHGEHLHACEGRDAEEGDGEYGRSVREQGKMRLLLRFRANARFSSFWGRCGAGGSVV